MLVNGTTLESLEVYRNATDHSERGSLFWALDKTLTRFGQRLLRKWVGRPLLDQKALEDRLEAVQELFDKQEDNWRNAFDLEREKVINAYHEKLDKELKTQSEINQSTRIESVQWSPVSRAINIQLNW